MFISTYSTYVNSSSINKSIKDKEESSSLSSKLFEKALNKSEAAGSKFIQNVPVNYISYNKTLGTKERIYEQLQQNTYQSSLKKISNITSKMNAPSAYAANSTMFSLMIKNPTILKHTESSNPLKNAKEDIKRSEMINTYVANDKYYQLTAS